FVVVQEQVYVLRLSFRQRELAAKPDVGGFPLGADNRARRAFSAEAAGAFFPGGIVEICLNPLFPWLLQSVSPGDPFFLRGRDDDANLGDSGEIAFIHSRY